jgi:mRNA interferase MazF
MAVARVPSRGEVVLVELDTTRGREIRKSRPCVIISPDELNHNLRTVIVAPMTTGGHAYPFRPACKFAGKAGRVALDQLRTVDRERLRKRLGSLSPANLVAVFGVLADMFEFS